MSKEKVYYCIDGDWQWASFECKSSWGSDNGDYQVEDCAADYHFNHDGWECDWPLVITVKDSSGRSVDYEVDRDCEPVFSARKVVSE